MKKTFQYYAIFSYANDGITVTFPDLEGCITSGRNLDEATAYAQTAMGLHIYGLYREGFTIPKPRQLKDINATDGASIILIDETLEL